jgi:hypothetical protein
MLYYNKNIHGGSHAMKKIALVLLFLLFTGCAYPQNETPGPMEPTPVPQDNSDVSVDEPEELEEPSDEVPIYLDDLPIILSIREPDTIGTIYMDATYNNKSEYPIVAYTMTILLKDQNEKVRLTNFDTVLPGETSPNFYSFGPETRKIDDVEKLELSITAMTENNKKLYIDYDYKLGMAEWFYAD